MIVNNYVCLWTARHVSDTRLLWIPPDASDAFLSRVEQEVIEYTRVMREGRPRAASFRRLRHPYGWIPVVGEWTCCHRAVNPRRYCFVHAQNGYQEVA